MLGLGMKRRWGIPTAGDVVDVVAIDADDEVEGRQDAARAEGGQAEGMEMEMEGWDGVGERPLKRVARNARRDLSEDGNEREGEGGPGGGVGPPGETVAR